MIPASEKSRRKITAGEEGEIFELPNDIIEKEFRPLSLDNAKERITTGKLKDIYFTFRLARQVLPDHIIEVVGSQKKGDSLKLYSRKVEVPEEDRERKERINQAMQNYYDGELDKKEIEKLIKEYKEYIEEKYPEGSELAQAYEKFGLEIPGWQMNLLYDEKNKKIKFCEVELKSGRNNLTINKLLENSDSAKEAIPRIESMCKIIISDNFSYIEKNYPDIPAEKIIELNKIVNQILNKLVKIFKFSGDDFKVWFTDKNLTDSLIKVFNIESILRKNSIEKTIIIYNEILQYLKKSKIKDPGVLVNIHNYIEKS
ncbi:hypothetical protein KKC88_05200 [Patescibacteria group bacterium]|nr:hypothetical protein [Patescibacteria group bacterium]MBU1673723.1 hypothetical protein [Patescibacteria group bacterium]MBU1963047.1 hypothetical protein [Patescibacteria group bacterium]